MRELLSELHADALRLTDVVRAELERAPVSPLMLRSRLAELERTTNALLVAHGTAQRIERSKR